MPSDMISSEHFTTMNIYAKSSKRSVEMVLMLLGQLLEVSWIITSLEGLLISTVCNMLTR